MKNIHVAIISLLLICMILSSFVYVLTEDKREKLNVKKRHKQQMTRYINEKNKKG